MCCSLCKNISANINFSRSFFLVTCHCFGLVQIPLVQHMNCFHLHYSTVDNNCNSFKFKCHRHCSTINYRRAQIFFHYQIHSFIPVSKLQLYYTHSHSIVSLFELISERFLFCLSIIDGTRSPHLI